MEAYFWDIAHGIIELTNILLCYSQILRVKVTRKISRLALWYGGLVAHTVLAIHYGWVVPIMVLNIFYGMLTVWLVVDTKPIAAIGLYQCVYMIEAIVNVEVSYICAMIADVPQYELTSRNSSVVLLKSSFIVIMIVKIVIEKLSSREQKQRYTFGYAMYVALYLASFSFMLLIGGVESVSLRYGISSVESNLLGFLLSTVCILFYVLFLWLANSIHKNEAYCTEKKMMEMYVSEQDKYINLVVEKDADMRSFRHDLKERMDVVVGLLSRKEYDEAYRYIEKLYEHYNDVVIERYTGDMAIDAIISQKKSIMDADNIELIWKGSDLSIPKTIEVYDLCTIYINVLNNAIEACKKLDITERYVEIETRISADNMYIMASNKLADKITFDEYGDPVSSKKDKNNHGYGSKNIRSTVEKYNGILMYSTDEGVFRLEIKI